MDDSISQRVVEWMRGQVHGAVQPFFDRSARDVRENKRITAELNAKNASQMQAMRDQNALVMDDFRHRMDNFRWPWTPPPQTAVRMGVNGAFPQLFPVNGFDPEGSGYDMESAVAAGLQPDATGHWSSRVPTTGLLLKGRGHPTFHKTEEGERAAGYEIHRDPGSKRYYSAPKPTSSDGVRG